MDGLVLRPAVRDDASALAGLTRQLGYPTTTRQSAERLGAVLEAGDHAVLVACDVDGEVIGWAHVFLALRVESDVFAELGGIVVSEEYRRRGVGRRLLTVAEEWAVRRGVTKLRIRSRVERVDSHRIFERRGFAVVKDQHVFDKSLPETIPVDSPSTSKG